MKLSVWLSFLINLQGHLLQKEGCEEARGYLPDCQSMLTVFSLLSGAQDCSSLWVGYSFSCLLSSPVRWGWGLTPGHPPVLCSVLCVPWDAHITCPSHTSWGIRPIKLAGLCPLTLSLPLEATEDDLFCFSWVGECFRWSLRVWHL